MEDRVTIAHSDLLIAAIVISGRFRDASAEQERLTLVEELLRLESNLGRALAEHARHALSESRGSHSKWDVAADGAQAFAALQSYAVALQRIASKYETLAAPVDTIEHQSATDRIDGISRP